MGAEAGIVKKRSGKPVVCYKRAAVDTSDLVEAQPVIPVLVLEPLHTKEIQIPLVGVVPQLADLETWVRLSAIGVAVTPPHCACAAYTTDGNMGPDVALLEFVSNLVHVSLNIRVRAPVDMVPGTMLRGNGDLEKGKESNQHGQHALGLAEVGHGVECNDAFVND
jgi:hypothetical protein